MILDHAISGEITGSEKRIIGKQEKSTIIGMHISGMKRIHDQEINERRT